MELPKRGATQPLPASSFSCFTVDQLPPLDRQIIIIGLLRSTASRRPSISTTCYQEAGTLLPCPSSSQLKLFEMSTSADPSRMSTGPVPRVSTSAQRTSC
ncbi:hypothetical protein CRE_26808 [Caenorhabditis remanei]|uniref:Uncharacterized protein n=1 Tax=Caenorhabditis remanei TaxID=31234 RepID=E3NGC4_CAERE|nr:hypothetical protein CRE_26808 [Caenorhabditis remanei]